MELKLEVDDLTVDQEATLIARFGCPAADLPGRLVGLATAAFADYRDMVLGIPLPGRAGEVKERRLLYLLKHYAQDGELLTEAEIGLMFQMNSQEARGLLRSARAHYRSDLDVRVKVLAKKVLESARLVDSHFRVQITSSNLLDAFRTTVTIQAPYLDQIRKVPGSAALFDIPPDTYPKLCQVYGAIPVG